MARMAAVRGCGIVKRFDGVIALDGADLNVTPRQIHELAGPNGAGKMTLLGVGRLLTAVRRRRRRAVRNQRPLHAAHPPATHGTRYGSSAAWSVR